MYRTVTMTNLTLNTEDGLEMGGPDGGNHTDAAHSGGVDSSEVELTWKKGAEVSSPSPSQSRTRPGQPFTLEQRQQHPQEKSQEQVQTPLHSGTDSESSGTLEWRRRRRIGEQSERSEAFSLAATRVSTDVSSDKSLDGEEEGEERGVEEGVERRGGRRRAYGRRNRPYEFRNAEYERPEGSLRKSSRSRISPRSSSEEREREERGQRERENSVLYGDSSESEWDRGVENGRRDERNLERNFEGPRNSDPSEWLKGKEMHATRRKGGRRSDPLYSGDMY